MKRTGISILISLLLNNMVFSQEIYFNSGLEGYWTGAIIRGNSVQNMTAEIFTQGDSLVVASSIPDWTYYSPRISGIQQSGDVLRFQTYYGEATMVLDTAYMEMIGNVRTDMPNVDLHLKKSLKPVQPGIIEKDLEFDLGDVRVKGTLIIPDNDEGPFPVVVFVHGRGCSTRDWQLNRGRKLAEYGIASVAFDKRGSRRDDIECTSTTLGDHSGDVARVIDQVLPMEEIDNSRLGLIGYSAGGWVAPAATALRKGKVAYLITIVGPSTDIKEQQLDGAFYTGKQRFGTTAKGEQQVRRYTELMFATRNYEKTFKEMEELLQEAETERWINWLEDTDIPENAEGIPKLWVNRFRNYDPAEDLAAFEGPFLSVLGENDDVVPWQTQIPRFKKIFGDAGKTNYRIVVAKAAGHGMEHGPTVRTLGYNRELRARPYYYKFDRVAYGAIHEIVQFLKDYKIIE